MELETKKILRFFSYETTEKYPENKIQFAETSDPGRTGINLIRVLGKVHIFLLLFCLTFLFNWSELLIEI